jgi:DNA-directed RNA polymerase beta' subunit
VFEDGSSGEVAEAEDEYFDGETTEETGEEEEEVVEEEVEEVVSSDTIERITESFENLGQHVLVGEVIDKVFHLHTYTFGVQSEA